MIESERLVRPAGSPESSPAVFKPSDEKDKDGLPCQVVVYSPKVLKPPNLVDRMLQKFQEDSSMLVEHHGANAASQISVEQVREGLRAEEALQAALLLEFEERDPRIVATGPSTEEMIAMIDTNRVPAQRNPTYHYEQRNSKLYGVDIEVPRAAVVESTPNVPQDPQILKIVKNYDKARAWLENLRKRGLDALNSTQFWVQLQMIALLEGKLIASETFDVLNANQLLETGALLGVGYWSDGQIRLNRRDPGGSGERLRVRASAGVDVSKA